jgi:hypothetical protein
MGSRKRPNIVDPVQPSKQERNVVSNKQRRQKARREISVTSQTTQPHAKPTTNSIAKPVAKLTMEHALQAMISRSIAMHSHKTTCRNTTPDASAVLSCEEIEECKRPTTRLYRELPIYYPTTKRTSTQDTEIRLIELRPTYVGDTISCNMYCTSLQKRPRFIALSYTWGENKKTQAIVVNNYKVHVTNNLRQAFMQMRGSRDSVSIW